MSGERFGQHRGRGAGPEMYQNLYRDMFRRKRQRNRAAARVGWFALIAVLLSACAGREVAQPQLVLSPSDWQLEGRLALSNGRDGGSGSLSWTQHSNDSQLAFVGAFGRGGWRLTVTPGNAELALNDGQVMVAPAVGELVTRATGWEIPVEALTFWVTGRAQPGFPVTTEENPLGYLDRLTQHGWRVQFDGRLPVGNGSLPRKITATRGSDKVRLLVKRWTI